MDTRVQGQPAKIPGRPIAEAVGCQGVAELVHREPDQQDDRDRDQGCDQLLTHETSGWVGATRTW